MNAENKLRAFYIKFKNKAFIFCTHKHADTDAVSSAYVLSKVFPKSMFAIPDEMNNAAMKLLEYFKIKPMLLSSALKKRHDAIIAVDTSSKALFPYDEMQDIGEKIIAVIDHHERGKDAFNAEYMFINNDARACAEIIANTFSKLKGKYAALLACGILSDTVRFVTANKNTIKAFMNMYRNSNYEYEKLLRLAFPKRPLYEKIAILKGLQRTKIVQYKDIIISLSHVGSNNGEVASLLANAGDIAFVAQKEGKAIRISARANMHIDIELNKVMENVASAFNGMGGGHKKAAGCIAYGNLNDVLEYCAKKTKDMLKNNKKRKK
ncbi:MAG: DHH family phosphoesterase [Candidatus Anstonellales archaeon]